MTPKIYELARENCLINRVLKLSEVYGMNKEDTLERLVVALAEKNAELEKLILDIYLDKYSENPMEKFDDLK